MYKIKDAVRKSIMDANLTSAQINFIVVISRYQSDDGRISGAYYNNICKEAYISAPTFYSTIRELEKKHIIKYVQNKKDGDWDIVILNNDFSNPETLKEGYLKMDHKIFYEKKFFKMTAMEKLLAMDLLRICQANGGKYHIKPVEFYEKYKKIFEKYAKNEELSKRVLQECLKTLKRYFSIYTKDKQYWFEPRKNVYQEDKINKTTEEGKYKLHIGTMICRRLKADYTQKTFNDLTGFIKQFSDKFIEFNLLPVQTIYKAAKKSIEKVNEGICKKSDWIRTLQPALINKILHKEFFTTEK